MFKTYMIYYMYSINMNNHFVGEAHILCIYLFQYILTFDFQLRELQRSNIRKKMFLQEQQSMSWVTKKK